MLELKLYRVSKGGHGCLQLYLLAMNFTLNEAAGKIWTLNERVQRI